MANMIKVITKDNDVIVFNNRPSRDNEASCSES